MAEKVGFPAMLLYARITLERLDYAWKRKSCCPLFGAADWWPSDVVRHLCSPLLIAS
jgi:hypothetical protein